MSSLPTGQVDWKSLPKHPLSEKIVQLLCTKTQNNNPSFFRILTASQLTTMAAMQRIKVHTQDRDIIPVNLYAIALAESGQGKGYSTNIFEEHLTTGFYDTFLKVTLPELEDQNLNKLAIHRAKYSGETDEDEYQKALREYISTGTVLTYFDSGTAPAYKQYRHKLLMCKAASLNFIMDEIGSNLVGNTDLLNTYLETFDKGFIKQKLIKNTAENVRVTEIKGSVPSNLMAYGTPVKLFDGASVEASFLSFLSTGFGRRCFFALAGAAVRDLSISSEERFKRQIAPSLDAEMQTIRQHLQELADISKYGLEIPILYDEGVRLQQYKDDCEDYAATLGEHDAIQQAEISHRYFKAAKLAGGYAFIDGESVVTRDNLDAAISLAEESGEAFQRILNRDPNYVKIAKYITSVKKSITHVDLMAKLPCFKGSNVQRKDLITSASTWAYQNDIIITSKTMSNIEYLQAETLEPTDLNKLVMSVSGDIASGYQTVEAPFNKLHQFLRKQDLHWINHRLKDGHLGTGHREDCNIIEGFNMLVLDIDEGDSIDAVRGVLQDFKYLIHTTKRHTTTHHRFRVLIPISHTLSLSAKEYLKCVNNILEYLPITVDTQTTQRARKWATTAGNQYWYNDSPDAVLFDIRPFIPNTPQNEERINTLKNLKDVSNLERWFLQQSGEGRRSNILVRYGMVLVDSGKPLNEIEDSIKKLNDRFEVPLAIQEIDQTIMVTVAKKITQREDI